MNTPPDARQGNDALSLPNPVAALAISHVEMNAAYNRGQAVPLGQTISWIARYGGSWWVECERGWLRVIDDLTATDLDQTAARLQAAEVVVTRDVRIGLGTTSGSEASVVAGEEPGLPSPWTSR